MSGTFSFDREYGATWFNSTGFLVYVVGTILRRMDGWPPEDRKLLWAMGEMGIVSLASFDDDSKRIEVCEYLCGDFVSDYQKDYFASFPVDTRTYAMEKLVELVDMAKNFLDTWDFDVPDDEASS